MSEHALPSILINDFSENVILRLPPDFYKKASTYLNKSEKILSNKVAKVLIKNDIYFAGIDLVSGKLIGDINVTSPTGLPQYKELTGINLAENFWNYLGLK